MQLVYTRLHELAVHDLLWGKAPDNLRHSLSELKEVCRCEALHRRKGEGVTPLSLSRDEGRG